MKPRKFAAALVRKTGFTLTELIVCLVIIAVLIFLAMPVTTGTPISGQKTQTLSNMKQLHLATQVMALDGITTGDTDLGWPGETGGTFSNWTCLLVQSNYLEQKDLCKLLSAPGIIVPTNAIPAMKDSAILVYSVSETNSGEAVLFTTANFTNTPHGGSQLDRRAKPYGDTGFVVFRRAGDGSILLPRQVGQTNVIGSFVPMCR